MASFDGRPKERTTPSAWTIRSPYRININRDDGDRRASSSNQPSTSTSTVDDDTQQEAPAKSMRTTRHTPAFLPNFVRTEPENASSSHKADGEQGPTQRLYNTLNPTYRFPCAADEVENKRQEHQHTAFSIVFRGLYPCPDAVRATLRDDGTAKAILDLGCGTGTWAIEMAREFPHATVLGVDIVPCTANPADIPSNCKFEIDDVNHGLDHFEEQFDLVHLRNLSMGLRNFRKTMEEVSKCLKPGGLAVFIEGDNELIHRDMVTVVPMAMLDHEIRKDSSVSGRPRSTSGSWLQRYFHEISHAAQIQGSDWSSAAEAIDEGLWRMDMYDPESCGASSAFVPIGPWLKAPDETSTVHLQHVGSLMRTDMLSLLRAAQSLLLQVGVHQSMIDQWIASATYELKAEKFESFARLRVAWGRRKRPANSDSPAQSSTSLESQAPVTETYSIYDRIRPNCQPVTTYASRTESLMAKEARNSTKTKQPVPFVIELANKKVLTK